MRAVVILMIVVLPAVSYAAGFGIFTQGASGLGQANAVVAHSTGPSSLYFNPALLNDVPGRQIEIGTTAIRAEREVDLASGGTERGHADWNFPSTFYYTHQVDEKLTAGVGLFSPFGLSNEWDEDYEGRFIGTSGEMLSLAVNPVLALRVTERLSLAAGFSFVYVDTELTRMVNQAVAGSLVPPELGGPVLEDLPAAEQEFAGDGWGAGYNAGLLFRATDYIAVGAAYRSQVKVEVEGDLNHSNVDPRLALLLPSGPAEAEIDLPAQLVAGVAVRLPWNLTAEAGLRWEDWDSNDLLVLESARPVLGDSTLVVPRDWHATWAYNVGGRCRVSENLALNAGYLYGENAVPDRTFEPIIPDTDAHLFTVGGEVAFRRWTFAAAFGYEHHESRRKDNGALVNDPLGSMAEGRPVGTADGVYDSDIYLTALSVGYAF